MGQGTERPITVGDLVRVVKNHGCTSDPHRGIGKVAVVERIEVAYAYHCVGCDRVLHELNGQALIYARCDRWGFYPMAWVRRIPPLEELEGERDEDDVTA